MMVPPLQQQQHRMLHDQDDDDSDGERGGGGGDQQEVIEVQILPQVSWNGNATPCTYFRYGLLSSKRFTILYRMGADDKLKESGGAGQAHKRLPLPLPLPLLPL